MFIIQMTATLLFVIFVSLPAGGQEPAIAVLNAEFGPIVCEHVHALTDSFAQDLAINPAARAVIVISTPPYSRDGARYQKLISSFLDSRNVDPDRIEFFRGAASSSTKTEFWLVPPGAKTPSIAQAPWPAKTFDLSRPFVFGYEDELAICSTFAAQSFSRLILQSEGAHAHIVLTGRSRTAAEQLGRSEIERLRSYNLPRKKIHLFYVIDAKSASSGAEYWFVPGRQ